jgi:ssDNA-binding Zn-finger/Zn-ribbon topoisomerase 1
MSTPSEIKRRLKLPFALRREQPVHISEVNSGKQNDCLCPECGKPLIAKKGSLITHHFAHDSRTTCNFETILHRVAKLLIRDAIARAIGEGKPLPVKWRCDYCKDEHSGNLVKKAAAVKLEQALGPVRPDLLLVSASDTPIAAIEVVVSHPPEFAARRFYRENDIELLVVRIESEAHLATLRNPQSLHAASGTLCTRRRCPTCRHPLMPSPLCVVIGDCYRCGRPMKIAFKVTDQGMLSPDKFSNEDVRRARIAGCVLEQRWSSTAQERYLSNICARCRAFCGRFHLHDYWYLADRTEQRIQQVHCPICDRHFDDPGISTLWKE